MTMTEGRSSRPAPSSDSVRKRMRATRRRDTPCELALRSAVHHLGLRFRVHRAIPGTRWRPDIVFVSARVVTWVDGCYWHACPIHGTWPKANAEWWREKILANVRRDRETDRRMRSLGWMVLRFWEHEDMDRAARIVARHVRRRTATP